MIDRKTEIFIAKPCLRIEYEFEVMLFEQKRIQMVTQGYLIYQVSVAVLTV